MSDSSPLTGWRRTLTQDDFEYLCTLQCKLPEILGWTGTTEKQLTSWVRRVYRRALFQTPVPTDDDSEESESED